MGTHVTAEWVAIIAGLCTIAWIVIQARTWMVRQRELAELAAVAQAEDRALLRRIDRELHPKNGDGGGPTLRDDVKRNTGRIDNLLSAVDQHRRETADADRTNMEAHDYLTRRIDGLWTLVTGNGGLHSLQDRHQQTREDDT